MATSDEFSVNDADLHVLYKWQQQEFNVARPQQMELATSDERHLKI
jgi:hypothetical protein